MVGGGRSVSRRLFVVGIALMLATPAVALLPGRAAAAHAVPWRFTSVVEQGSQVDAFSVQSWVLQCPAGYTAVSGGVYSVAHPSGVNFAAQYVHRVLEYPNPADGTYHIQVRNDDYLAVAVSVKANCVWLDDVGTITTVTTEFARNGSGRAGGILRCPAGTSVLSGGVDWSNFNAGRNIDYTTPITDGTSLFTGWYVAGYSPVAGVLGIELRCVSSSLLAGAWATADDSTAASPGVGDVTATCGSGTRILTGGAGPAGTKSPGSDQGQAFVSGPSHDNASTYWKEWRATAYQASGSRCVPSHCACPPVLCPRRSRRRRRTHRRAVARSRSRRATQPAKHWPTSAASTAALCHARLAVPSAGGRLRMASRNSP